MLSSRTHLPVPAHDPTVTENDDCKSKQVTRTNKMALNLEPKTLNQNGLSQMDIFGITPCSVPSYGLPLMQVDSSVPQQGLLQQLVQRTNPVWLAEHVHIVQERIELLSRQHGNCDLFQCLLNPNGEEEWHQWIALLTTFCLGDGSTVPFLINPTVPGWLLWLNGAHSASNTLVNCVAKVLTHQTSH